MGRLLNSSYVLAALCFIASVPASAQSLLDPTKGMDHVILKTAEVDAIGTYLTNQEGRAVYMFTVEKSGQVECRGPCAKDWAPVMTRSDASAGAGVDGDKIGTISSGGAERQVTYANHPLYYFIHDGGKAGATTGQAVASYSGFWYLLAPGGTPITAKRPGEFPEPEKREPRN